MIVREADPSDTDRLLELMIGLATFEDYIAEFAVTKESILANGFGEDAIFKVFVAVVDGDIVGIAVTYVVPWTYTLRPKLVLKELFVDDGSRHIGVGKALFKAVENRARDIGATEIEWTVMDGNTRAEAFYRTVGGNPDPKWNNWVRRLT